MQGKARFDVKQLVCTHYFQIIIENGGQLMSKQTVEQNSPANQPIPQAEPGTLLKTIGSTTFVVNVHFSETSKETIAEKILRLVQREVA
jgi:hypothetical protein